MKKYLFLISLFLIVHATAQNKIYWNDDYKLKIEDYEATPPNTGYIQTVYGSYYIGLELHNYELWFKKNLNNNVYCYFQKDASYFDAGDSATTTLLLRYQQLIFDIYELDTRKLRQKFYTDKKRLRAQSGPNIMLEEALADNAKTISKIEKETRNGTLVREIEKWEAWVKSELDKLSDFCQDCKPKKK